MWLLRLVLFFIYFWQQTVQVWLLKEQYQRLNGSKCSHVSIIVVVYLVFQIMHQVGFIPNDSLSSHHRLVGNATTSSSYSHMRAIIFWFRSGLHRKVQQRKVTKHLLLKEHFQHWCYLSAVTTILSWSLKPEFHETIIKTCSLCLWCGLYWVLILF